MILVDVLVDYVDVVTRNEERNRTYFKVITLQQHQVVIVANGIQFSQLQRDIFRFGTEDLGTDMLI
ncbi:hypothetical protein M9Y10_034565 [Tritrichomonas musculus]|uniref:Uncharacterized protein n=1 Tax=Tritrichomonas musculus TaxID=1915356 RepID=A0ABR2KFB9_9EUKA